MILGVDTGGTFTDFYLIADDGAVTVHKRPSTPGDPARAIMEGVDDLIASLGLIASGLEVVHGSTVATNAIIERRGARTGLITTRGFADVLAIGRQVRPRLYDLSPRREPPLVPEELRLEATERLDHRGNVLSPLDPAEVESLLDRAQAAGAESLAVCFLFSFLDPRHERLVARAARRRGIPVSASHEVLPEHREYERTATTVANAYVAPVMMGYLSHLQSAARRRGVGRLRVMASNGGSMSAAAAGRLAVRTTLSGPAGGVTGAFALARQAGFDRIITLDMGGTSTDVALCPGRITERDETLVGGLPIRGPTVDVLSVGAGGGSIARLDPGGALRVGPESAGAEPGPACYGKGTEPTVTDAHLILGRLDPSRFLGGRMSLRPDMAAAALRPLSEAFRGRLERAAAAVLRVANANMERALRVVSVERGHDPRLFTLVAFGGAGPLHACDLAAALGIRRILIPPHPGVLSALGMASSDVVKDVSTSVLLRFPPPGKTIEDRRLARLRAQLLRRGRSELESEGFSVQNLQAQTVLQMRYVGQSYELPVVVDDLIPGRFLPLFHQAHRERYGHADPSRTVEVVALRLKLTLPASTPPPHPPRSSRRPGRPPALGRRPVWFDDRSLATSVYLRHDLAPGATIRGPAIIAQMDATTALPPGWRAEVDEQGNLILEPHG